MVGVCPGGISHGGHCPEGICQGVYVRAICPDTSANIQFDKNMVRDYDLGDARHFK